MNKLSAPTGIARASPEYTTYMSTISGPTADEVADHLTTINVAKKQLAA